MSRVLEGLGHVCYGLKVVSIGLMVMLAAVVALLLAVAANLPEFLSSDGVLPDGAKYVVTFLFVLGSAVGLVGKSYCMRAPEEAKAGGLGFAALLFSGFGLTVHVTSRVPALAEGMKSVAPLGGLFVLLGYFTFLGFLRRICEFINAPGLAGGVAGVQTGSILALLMVVIAGSREAPGGRPSPFALALVLAGGVLALGLFARYAMLLARVRRAIEHQMERAYEELGSK